MLETLMFDVPEKLIELFEIIKNPKVKNFSKWRAQKVEFPVLSKQISEFVCYGQCRMNPFPKFKIIQNINFLGVLNVLQAVKRRKGIILLLGCY